MFEVTRFLTTFSSSGNCCRNFDEACCVTPNTPAITDKEKSQRKLGKVGNPTGNNQYTEQEKRKGDDSHHSYTRGTGNADYLLDRIERDYPETYESIKAGEFKSARAAAISVGLVKKDDRWSAPGPVEKLATLIRKRYSEEEIYKFYIG